MYNLKTGDYYNSAIGINELAKVLGKTRTETLTSLRRYLKNENYIKDTNGTKLKLLNQFMLGGDKHDNRSKH